ncbi:MAG: hypothetical protein P0Y65_08895 [Candidatus Devosia phytovorans]|uniref:YbgF trimerisation domain-containing protein n=1 Tax=Candidatus Devosia phytovorans TaxID=3121372 RepID=A0AAJ5VZP1_9HYPH|nr:hypothetical protein [Devosia sp.]WEK06347.1 MAG: hypothetical protein P0Y65_08895 [Devosia sp.]
MKRIFGAAMMVLLAGAPAMAACPAAVPGDSVEEIEANRLRVICLQQQASQDARIRSIEMDIQMLQMKQHQLDLQRRFDNLPRYEPPKIVIPR